MYKKNSDIGDEHDGMTHNAYKTINTFHFMFVRLSIDIVKIYGN